MSPDAPRRRPPHRDPEDSPALAGVRLALDRFQNGYTRRDPDTLDAFMDLFAPGAEVEVIGTNAAVPGEGEWCLGPAAVRRLVADDWEGWGNVELDLDEARIHIRGDVAWFSVWGTVSDVEEVEDTYRDSLERIRWLLGQDLGDQDLLLGVAREATDTLLELPRGQTYIWPLRLSGVLVRQGERWRFHQLHFSFPTTRLPDVRLAVGEEEPE